MSEFNQQSDIASTLTQQSVDRHRRKRARRAGQFLKGPIPLNWWTKAAALPGKALAFASAVWYKAGLTKTTTNLAVGEELAKEFGVHRRARYRAQHELQKAGLISLDQKPGCLPRISLITTTNRHNQ